MSVLPFDRKSCAVLVTPEIYEAITPPPLLLPGERLKDYQTLRRAIIEEITPTSTIEWLLTIDVVEISWELQRYRKLRHKMLEKSRQYAIANALKGELQTSLNAFAWRSDAHAAREIELRLASYGIDELALNTEVHIQFRELYLMFEEMITSAQYRRAALLKEMALRRKTASRYARAKRSN